MTDFRIQSLQQVMTEYFHNDSFIKVFSMAIFLLSMPLYAPLYAENNYLFPSDIIDQGEQAQYDTDRASRYASQRDWFYPENPRTNTSTEIQSREIPAYYPDSRQYPVIDGHSNSQSMDAEYGFPRYPESDHYKYDDFKPAPPMNYGSIEQGYTEHRSTDRQNRNIPATLYRDTRYNPDRINNYADDFQQGISDNSLNYPQDSSQQRYAREYQAGETYPYSYQRDNKQSYPDLLFPGDVEANARFMKKNDGQYHYHSKNQIEQAISRPQVKEKIRYIPVPVYRVPGTLPGTVPGVVTPGNMVPGYSHLSPDYSYGPGRSSYDRGYKRNLYNSSMFNNFLGQQYNPLDSFGTFPTIGNPFSSLYNNEGKNSFNSLPYTNPNFMMPGFSMYDMFPGSR